ncbi:MAG: ATP-grasp domain-containing protein [Thaumarchaeota archaeon]|nr:ATP-grasp domain-containing protein [Nitrososphaerota archaeon]
MAVIQSLRLAPEELNVVGVDMDPLAAGFRALQHHERVPGALSRDYIPDMLAVSKRYRIDTVIPTVDEEIEVLAENEHIFREAGVSIPLPSRESVATARDKYAISSVERVGIPGPKTFLLDSEESIDEAIRELRLPCVIKQRSGRGGRGFAVIDTPADAHFWYSKAKKQVLLQEKIDGDLLLVQAIADKGRILLSIVHRRLATKGEGSGTAISAVTVRDDASVRLLATVLEKLNWRGAVGAEFLVRGSERLLIDLNPRICGQSHLSARAGMNLAYALVEMAAMGKITLQNDYEVGKVYVRLWSDEVFDVSELGDGFAKVSNVTRT